jgi:hypothetical protein
MARWFDTGATLDDVQTETRLALLVHARGKPEWIPRSEAQWIRKESGETSLYVSWWLAQNRGMIGRK